MDLILCIVFILVGMVTALCLVDTLLSFMFFEDDEKILKHTNNTCIFCGDIIPEGRQICPNCEHNISSDLNKTAN